MKRNHLLAVSVVVFSVILLFSCKKIFLPTELGQDLIPDVDNIHTFDTSLDVATYNHIFNAQNDTFKSLATDEHFLGLLNDPIFGKTDARIFFQVSTPSNKFTFNNVANKLTLDSVVLVLDYLETYGDTTVPQTIQVSEISQSSPFTNDSIYSLRKNDIVTTSILGTKVVYPYLLNDSIKGLFGADSIGVVNQLRIKLDNSFGRRLLDYDTIGVNDGYSTDSIFKTKFKGFALQSIGSGNGIMGFNMTNAKLNVYYKYENKTTAGDIDTTVATFKFNNSSYYAAHANYIGRDYSSTNINSISGDNVADPLIYIQNSPGTYAMIKIPGLPTMSNRIVHLAELQMESIYDVSDTTFSPPTDMYIDSYVDSASKYKLLPYFLDQNGRYAGQFFDYKKDPTGKLIKQWRYNITRYVQGVLTKRVQAYDLRLHATPALRTSIPYIGIGDQVYDFKPQETAGFQYISPAKGRVRLGGGNRPTQKMKLRIVYSKI